MDPRFQLQIQLRSVKKNFDSKNFWLPEFNWIHIQFFVSLKVLLDGAWVTQTDLSKPYDIGGQLKIHTEFQSHEFQLLLIEKISLEICFLHDFLGQMCRSLPKLQAHKLNFAGKWRHTNNSNISFVHIWIYQDWTNFSNQKPECLWLKCLLKFHQWYKVWSWR